MTHAASRCLLQPELQTSRSGEERSSLSRPDPYKLGRDAALCCLQHNIHAFILSTICSHKADQPSLTPSVLIPRQIHGSLVLLLPTTEAHDCAPSVDRKREDEYLEKTFNPLLHLLRFSTLRQHGHETLDESRWTPYHKAVSITIITTRDTFVWA